MTGIAGSSNGRAPDLGSGDGGSIPPLVATNDLEAIEWAMSGHQLRLWHGESVWVDTGDVVRVYFGSDGTMIPVEVEHHD